MASTLKRIAIATAGTATKIFKPTYPYRAASDFELHFAELARDHYLYLISTQPAHPGTKIRIASYLYYKWVCESKNVLTNEKN